MGSPASEASESVYRIPSGVGVKRLGKRIYLTHPAGGWIAVDRSMLNLWRNAEGHTLTALLAEANENALERECRRGMLACLAEAGLLERERPAQPTNTPTIIPKAKVSVVMVTHNSLTWLPRCLASLASQTISPCEIIVVDNASTDGISDWLRENAPQIRTIQLSPLVSLACALNRGLEAACGEFFLVLNPDVELEPQAIAQMVAAAREAPSCAAIAVKLRFLWTPSFLNGVGNFVAAFSWGSDIGIGHLDLGQFDHWREVPSACFAAALIPAYAWREVGPFDEGLPLYYEDSEWCYRARLMGYTIRFASGAVVYHAMGARQPSDRPAGLSAAKLRQVTYGRLRFATRLLGLGYLLRFLLGYALEDALNCLGNLLLGRWGKSGAYLAAWGRYLAHLPRLWVERRAIQARRRISDGLLFQPQRALPPALVWRGTPLLTRDIVLYHYLPRILNGETKPLPEFSPTPVNKALLSQIARQRHSLKRAADLLREEGVLGLFQRLWRAVQGLLMRP